MLALDIERLLYYAEVKLGLDEFDKLYARNAIMDLIGLTDTNCEELTDAVRHEIEVMTVPDAVLKPFGELAVKNGTVEEFELPNYYARIMGHLTPAPSIVRDEFFRIKKEKGAEDACLYLYNLSVLNNYIQKTALDRNIYWKAETGKNYIEVTINLAKPEKTNAETAKMLTVKASGYPKCLLCCENLGYFGGAKQGARQNLRFVPLELDGEEWFLQYSPFIYYDEHCIVFSKAHTPMKVDASTIRKLISFVEQYPHYFIGSNASLPIVGGSILTHEHFQAGRHLMPLHYAPDKEYYIFKDFEDITVSKADWYNSVLRLKGKNHDRLAVLANKVINAWYDYTDTAVSILAKTEANGKTQQHNAVTPIARMTEEGVVIDIIFRNNRCDQEFPEGIFHAHPEYHNIKKESIGLIEAMGMFILPGRLKRETAVLEEYLTGKRNFNETEFISSKEAVHLDMLKKMLNANGAKNTSARAKEIIKSEMNDICVNILKNTAVFKDDKTGIDAWNKFLYTIK